MNKRKQHIDENDIRKTAKTNKRQRSKVNIKNSIYPIIIIIVIIIGIVLINNRKLNIKNDEIKEYNYFLLSENDKIGIIDKTGTIIIQPEYDYIQIPNPEKPIFICLFNYDSKTQSYNSKVLNEKGKQIYSKYENITAIPSNNTSSQSNYQTNILKYNEDGKYGILTITGKRVTKPIYDSIESLDYKDETLKIKQNGKYGLIKLNGEKIIKPEYELISTDGYYDDKTIYANSGYIVTVKDDNGYHYGYMDSKGKKVLDSSYEIINRITEIKNETTP